MKLTERQTAAWMALGEKLSDVCTRVLDLSLPDDVALDRAWLVRSVREVMKLATRWTKTFPVRRTAANTVRRKARADMLFEVLPMLIVEVAGPGSTAYASYEGKTISAGESPPPPPALAANHEEPN